MRTINNPLTSCFFLSKIDIPFIKKMLNKELAKHLPSSCIMLEQFNNQVNCFISAINTTMDFAIPRAIISLKSVPGFYKKCKKVQIKVKRLEI